jgi:RimJ/RimL family protein N-acetyltransferase
LSVLVLPGSLRAGVGCDALELVVEWAQGGHGLHRFEVQTLPESAPRLAEASGFSREGVVRDHAVERGRFADNVVYDRLQA